MTLNRIFQLPQATDNNHERFVATPKFSEMALFFLNDLGFTLELRSPSNFKMTCNTPKLGRSGIWVRGVLLLRSITQDIYRTTKKSFENDTLDLTKSAPQWCSSWSKGLAHKSTLLSKNSAYRCKLEIIYRASLLIKVIVVGSIVGGLAYGFLGPLFDTFKVVGEGYTESLETANICVAAKVPQPSDPIENLADEVVYKELDDSLVRAATTASSLEAEQEGSNINKTQSKLVATTTTTEDDDDIHCSSTYKMKSKNPKNKGVCYTIASLMKKKDLIRLDEEATLKLQAEFDEEKGLAKR
ncbi:hypothetical protein Tco_0053503 [Tanacetum coccineum]